MWRKREKQFGSQFNSIINKRHLHSRQKLGLAYQVCHGKEKGYRGIYEHLNSKFMNYQAPRISHLALAKKLVTALPSYNMCCKDTYQSFITCLQIEARIEAYRWNLGTLPLRRKRTKMEYINNCTMKPPLPTKMQPMKDCKELRFEDFWNPNEAIITKNSSSNITHFDFNLYGSIIAKKNTVYHPYELCEH